MKPGCVIVPRYAALMLSLGFAALPAAGQVLYGSIVGSVQDPLSAPVPGAVVSIRQTETGASRTASSNDNGSFSFPTLAGGTYDLSVNRAGFAPFTRSSVTVVVDQLARVDVVLQLAGVSQSVNVSGQTAALQTDSAEVRMEFGSHALQDLPAPANRNYENLLVTVPGFSPPANQNVAQSNPSRGLAFSVNGGGRNTNNIRIDGASSNNIWVEVAGYIPSIEAIETVNVVTNGFEASQGLAGGAMVNVHIKSGTNQLHGTAFGYNTNNAITARPFFAPVTQRQAKYIDNDFGGVLGGPVVKNRLFYFISYDGQFIRQNAGTYVTVPTADIRAGNMSGSPAPIYDPSTGAADGSGRTPFPGNIIAASRISPITTKLEGITPLPNVPGGALTTNYYGTGDYSLTRHTTDGKVDWSATRKLTISTRMGWLNHNVTDPPVFGDNGPPVSTGGREGTGFGNSFSSAISGTYVARPNLVVDSYYSATVIATNNDVPKLDQQLGLTYLGIPGTNGPGRPYGGWPQFTVTGYTDIGNPGNIGGPIYYDDRQYQFALNTTWVKGAHNLRFGFEWSQQDANHFEVTTAPGHLTFSNSLTTINAKGAAGGNQFNSYAAFLLGLASSAESDIMPFDNNRAINFMPSYRAYGQDQWQASRKLTVTVGLGWNYFPIGHRLSRGLERYNFQTNEVELCGVGGTPSDCGYQVSNRLFSPTLGLAVRPVNGLVIRAAYSLNYDPETYAYNRNMTLNYPSSLSYTSTGANSWTPATTLAKGITPVPVPDISKGSIPLPAGIAINTLLPKPVRDYSQSWNVTIQKQLPWDFAAQAGYVANRGVDIPQALNLNAAQVGGGTASEPFNRLFGTTAAINLFTPVNHTHYDGLQSSLHRRLAKGAMLAVNYTFSKAHGICCDDLSSGAPAINLPQYWNLARALEPTDRTHNFNVAATLAAPFGKGQRFLNHGGIAAAVASGWQMNGIFVRYSGSPFSVTGSTASLNATGNTQRADQVKPSVAILGGTGPGQSYFDPLAFASVTDVRFGTAGYYTLRGPGTTNLDLSLYRVFHLSERLSMQFRAEAFNLTNTPHFANPGANTSSMVLNPDGSIKSLGSYTVISATTGTGREGIDQRALRFGLRIAF